VKFEELPATIRGRKAERAVSLWLQSLGWYVLPAYDYAGLGEGKAPRLEGPQPAVVPDLLTARDGAGRWCEVKFKQHADWTRATGRYETGIPTRHWLDYGRVRTITGTDVWLMFVHEDEDEIRGGEIDYLSRAWCAHGSDAFPILREYEGDRMSSGGMTFFCWKCLAPLARTSDVLALQPVPA